MDVREDGDDAQESRSGADGGVSSDVDASGSLVGGDVSKHIAGVLDAGVNVSTPKNVLEARLMVSGKRIFSAPENEASEDGGGSLPIFYYHPTTNPYVIRDLKKWLNECHYIIIYEAPDGIFIVKLDTGEQVRLVPEPLPQAVIDLERELDQAEKNRWKAQCAVSDFEGKFESGKDFFNRYPALKKEEFVDLAERTASDFGIAAEGDVALFDQWVFLMRAEHDQVQRKMDLKHAISVHEISPMLDEAERCGTPEELRAFRERFNAAHPQGFVEDRYSVVRELSGAVLAFNARGHLQVFSSREELYALMESDSLRHVVQRLPKVSDDSNLREGRITDDMVLDASGELLRILETQLGVKKPIHVIYGLGKDLGGRDSGRFDLRFFDAKGKILGNVNWYHGRDEDDVMEAGQLEIANHHLMLRGQGAGRAIVEVKKKLGRALGYGFMEIKPDNHYFWAYMFAEDAEGISPEEAHEVIASVNWRGAKKAQVGPWSYDADRNTFWRRPL